MNRLQSVAFQYLKEAQIARRYYHSTLRMHRSHLGSLCGYTSKNILELEREDLQGWIDFQIGEAGESEKTISTIAYRFAGIRAFYAFMLKTGRIAVNPTDLVEVPETIAPDTIWLDEDQAEQLLAAPRRAQLAGDIKSYRMNLDRLILELLYGSGLRVSEAIRLRTEDIFSSKPGNPRSRMVCIRSKQHGDRNVPLTLTCQQALDAYLGDRPASSAANLLVSRRGFALKPDYFQAIVFDYTQRQQLDPRISPHKLRHSFAMAQLARGIDLESLRQLLGNRSIATLERYITPEETPSACCIPLFIPV